MILKFLSNSGHICQKMTFHGNYHHEKQFVEIFMHSELEHKTKAFDHTVHVSERK